MIGDNRFIEKIKINNVLSFGPDIKEIELKSLNVLVGPNEGNAERRVRQRRPFFRNS